MNIPQKMIGPVIKWSGSKRRVAPYLSKFIPEAKRYIEPFVGGGAMLPFRSIKNGIAGDIIPELIQLWIMIKNCPEETANEYQKRWIRLQNDGHQVYYEIRDSFNKNRNVYDFLFLTRTCVNGLIRFNSSGDFNNSFHLSRPGIRPEKLRKIIKMWSYYLQDVEFVVSDYRRTIESASNKDFIFLDPPYGGTNGQYTKDSFYLETFYSELDKMNSKEIKWMLTFDGKAGEREYKYELPNDLYKHRFYVKTGKSPFTKLMKTSIDTIYESVYLNYDPVLNHIERYFTKCQ